MQNWRTTTAALVTAALGFVAFSPEFFPPVVVSLSKYAMLGGLAALGINARDKQSRASTEAVKRWLESQNRK